MDIPNDDSVTPADIEPRADLGGTDLRNADLSGADLREANLRNVDLSEADLRGADLEEATIVVGTLSEADLRGADLSEADLRSADLSDAYLAGTSLSDASLSRDTTVEPPRHRLKREADELDSEFYDRVARANHELRTAYSANGLISQARRARVRERRARRNEAKADDSVRGTLAWAGSLASRVVTGYGVQLLPLGVVMLALFLGSAAVYWSTGMAPRESLYYSVVTFTTSPPSAPTPGLMRVVAGFETFVGTAVIIFLGYVLGTRERV